MFVIITKKRFNELRDGRQLLWDELGRIKSRLATTEQQIGYITSEIRSLVGDHSEAGDYYALFNLRSMKSTLVALLDALGYERVPPDNSGWTVRKKPTADK